MSEFKVDNSRLFDLASDILQDMHNGLSKDKSSLLMIPTYITRLPTGNEEGNYLALDFGGSTFRVIHVGLKPNDDPILKTTVISMDERMKHVDGSELFDHLASCVGTFVKQESLEKEKLLLGFTFSFPMDQTSLCKGRLVRWTKGFENNGVIGEDVAQLLTSSLRNNELTANVEVVALANDTAGTLVAGAMKYPTCRAGLIFGTGTNGAYSEKICNVPALRETETTEEQVVINMEWGNFGEHGQLSDLQTKFDKILDSASSNPGKQLYEKMISGMYMGELVRLALLERVSTQSLFNAEPPLALNTPNSLEAAVVSDCIRDFAHVRNFFGTAISADDVAVIQEVCRSVSDRAARLAAAGVYAIWEKRGKEEFVVAVDGSVFSKHATFSDVLKQTLKDMGCSVKLETATDGSGLGSALVAAVA